MNDDSQRQAKEAAIADLRQRIAQLEQELAPAGPRWRAPRYYTSYLATTGFLLGAFGAAASLLLNVVGSTLVGQHPLELIRVYLTFPLGEKALSLGLENGLVLAFGCCLYVGTGMLLGIVFQLVLAFFGDDNGHVPLGKRMAVSSVLAIAIWLVGFYGLLAWLQPIFFGGDWIVRLVPWYIAALTHLVYGWTMALVYPLGVSAPNNATTQNA
jgi:hypothetical protein